MCLLTAFNIIVLLVPPKALASLLTLMYLPMAPRYILLVAAATNVIIATAFEKWGTQAVSTIIGAVMRWHRGKKRMRDGKTYKAIESGMR